MVSSPFAQLVGQPQAVQLLTRAIASHRIAPAYVFIGPQGVGRSLAALEFLSLLIQTREQRSPLRTQLENHPDILRLEPTYLKNGKLIAASAFSQTPDSRPKSRPQIRVAQIRELTRFIHQTPLEATRLLVLIDEADLMGEAAANALLKTLEEPGNACLILLATTTEALLPTILSRCQKIPFYGLSTADLAQVLTAAGYDHILHSPTLMRLAQGSPGAAIAHWQKRQDLDPDLLARCLCPPPHDEASLALARDIDRQLDLETQLWLVDYLQQHYWFEQGQISIVRILENTKMSLRQYVQPQLTWEVTWFAIAEQAAA
ncbi:AAA family ATPase [Lyngbya confervoides]|uniref:AAA family ATPase n=1 Tax=Lyngbya confervoides BDU141951 TaxID=1574623 RepID=A0ABD4T8Y2_9CYAN|nr:AAA family ATPase [Lyngbya confervoides]MCM1984730.1 AAA family ATPase [Lyngbya confervoides BDU141951]